MDTRRLKNAIAIMTGCLTAAALLVAPLQAQDTTSAGTTTRRDTMQAGRVDSSSLHTGQRTTLDTAKTKVDSAGGQIAPASPNDTSSRMPMGPTRPPGTEPNPAVPPAPGSPPPPGTPPATPGTPPIAGSRVSLS